MDIVNEIIKWFGKNWDEVIPIAISALAAIFAGIALRHTKAQKEASQAQASSAQTQANAAEAQVEQMQRQNELLAKQLEQFENQTNQALPYVSPWSLKWHKGDTYELVNGGNEREYNVVIDFLEHEMFDKEQWEYIDPRSSKTFMYISTFGSPQRDVKITWSRDPEGKDKHSWEGLVPPKG